MYEFQTSEGQSLKIRFHHHKAGKGMPPKSTTCHIVDPGNMLDRPELLLGEGISRRCAQTPLIVDAGDIEDTVLAYNKAVKKVYRTDDKKKGIIILTADNFSYNRARKVALKKALVASGLNKADRRAAYAAVLGDIVKAPVEEVAAVAVS